MAPSKRTIDLHGMNIYQAERAIEAALRKSWGLYRIRLIHGYRQGTALRNFIHTNYANDPRILRLDSSQAGVTDLVLQEL